MSNMESPTIEDVLRWHMQGVAVPCTNGTILQLVEEIIRLRGGCGHEAELEAAHVLLDEANVGSRKMSLDRRICLLDIKRLEAELGVGEEG